MNLSQDHMKKVLTRIDGQKYVTNLEEEVAATRGEEYLANLRSHGDYVHLSMFS